MVVHYGDVHHLLPCTHTHIHIHIHTHTHTHIRTHTHTHISGWIHCSSAASRPGGQRRPSSHGGTGTAVQSSELSWKGEPWLNDLWPDPNTYQLLRSIVMFCSCIRMYVHMYILLSALTTDVNETFQPSCQWKMWMIWTTWRLLTR